MAKKWYNTYFVSRAKKEKFKCYLDANQYEYEISHCGSGYYVTVHLTERELLKVNAEYFFKEENDDV